MSSYSIKKIQEGSSESKHIIQNMETKLMLGSKYDPAGSEPSQAYPIHGRV